MTDKIKIKLYESMIRIRMLEEEIVREYPNGEMRCPTHLSIGQEAVAAALGLCVNHKDLAISTHRGHAHYIGKGGNINSMIAEIYGKATGCSKGKGGSMHLIDISVGFMGTSAIVGNSIPVGVGLALASTILKSDQIISIFFGDGATEEGAYYESINFAVLKNLPILFLCENNLYSVYSPLEVRQPLNRKITDVAKAMGLEVKEANGNDPIETYKSIENSISNIKNNRGPQLIEFSTYRWYEHCGVNFDNNLGYRTEKEYLKWKQTDPISNFKLKLIDENILTENEIEKINFRVKLEIIKAFKFAKNSPFPPPEEAFSGEYSK